MPSQVAAALVAQGYRFQQGYPPGTARSTGVIWPHPYQQSNGPNNVDGWDLKTLTNIAFANRQTGAAPGMFGTTILGLNCAALPCNGGSTNGQASRADGGTIQPRLGKTPIPAYADDFACARFVATFCSNGVGPALGGQGDCCVGLTQQNSFGCPNLDTLQACMGFRIDENGAYRFYARAQAQAITETIISPNGVSAVNAWHCCELVIIGATATLDAQARVYFDGAQVVLPVSLSSWAAATSKLPPAATLSNRSGFGMMFCNVSAIATTQYIRSILLVQGPDILSLY